MTDGFVKSGAPIATKYAMGRAALRCILRHCGVATSTPHSSGFARLRVPTFVGDVAFYKVVHFWCFYEFITSILLHLSSGMFLQ